MLGLVDAASWSQLDDLLANWAQHSGGPLHKYSWNKMLHRLTYALDVTAFPRLVQRYQEMGHPMDTAIHTSTMLWLIRHRMYGELPAAFQRISEPDAIAHRTYMSGLLRGGLAQDAKRALHGLVLAGHTVDVVNCNFLLKMLIEADDLAGAAETIGWMRLGNIAFDATTVPSLLLNVRSRSAFEAARGTLVASDPLDPHALSAVMNSPWGRSESFSVVPVHELARQFSLQLDLKFFRKLAERAAATPRLLLETLGLQWSHPEGSSLARSLFDAKQMGVARPCPVEIAEMAVDRHCDQAELVEAAGHVCVRMLRQYGRFDHAVLGRVADRLLFRGHHELAVECILGLFGSTSVRATGMCNSLLKRLYEAGKFGLGERVIEMLKRSGSPHLQPTILYGACLFGLDTNAELALVEQNAANFDLETLLSHVKALLKADRLTEAKALLERHEARFTDGADVKKLLITKLSVVAKVPGKQNLVDCLEAVKLQYAQSSPSVASVADFALRLLNKEPVLHTLAIGTENADLVRSVANAVFLNTCRYRSVATALSVRRHLFSAIKPNLSTFKAHLRLLLNHPEHIGNPVAILNDIRAAGLELDADVLNQILEAAIASKKEHLISEMLSRMLADGGVPDQRIFDQLFRWVQSSGDMANALELCETMRKFHVPIPPTGFDTLVQKCLDEENLRGARSYLEAACGEARGRSKCSAAVVAGYFEAYYKCHTLDECQTEIDALIDRGYTVPTGFYTAFLEHALKQGNAHSARRYFNRLRHQGGHVDPDVYERIIDLYLRDRCIDSAHQVWSAMQRAPEGTAALKTRWPAFPALLREKLPLCLERDPEFLVNLRVPPAGQPAYSAQPVLEYAISQRRMLGSTWSQRVLENLVARGDFGLANQLMVFMMTKGLEGSSEMAVDVCKNWCMFLHRPRLLARRPD